MKPLIGYFFLALAISCGIAANSFAKISDGFTKLTPSIACLLLMSITMFSLAKGMSAIPVGFAYATYSAVTVAAILIFGIIKYNQIPNIYGLIGIFLIIAGVLIVNLLGKVNWYVQKKIFKLNFFFNNGFWNEFVYDFDNYIH